MLYKEYQPLRISAGWIIEINSFFEVDPTIENFNQGYFAETLLYITSERRKRTIELQWQPEDDPNGNFILKVINLEKEYNNNTKEYIFSGDWGDPHFVFKSKNRIEVVEKIEELMFLLDEYKS